MSQLVVDNRDPAIQGVFFRNPLVVPMIKVFAGPP
jgi:hypothetical protein